MSTLDAPRFLDLAESVADGSPVDWAAVEGQASPDDRAIVDHLRIISKIAVLHRSRPADGAAAPASRPAATGAAGTWGHLRLIERLGGGRSGDVYRAWDPHLEREVALKLLRTDTAPDDSRFSPIVREGRLIARVRHPNVITVHGVAMHDGRCGLWMELVRGATLEEALLKGGLFGAREAALIGIDLCRALAAIHAAGLIHRDVKAQNVMREDGGRIVLMDLGTGRDRDRHAEPGDMAGTPLYFAPEILEGRPAGPATDLYSLGVLMYHLVTGSFPVRVSTLEQLIAAHARRERVLLRDARPDLPSAFVRIIDRALAHDPGRRYATAGALEAGLASTLDEATSESRRSVRAFAGGALLWPRALRVVAALLILGIVVSAGFALTRWGSGDAGTARPATSAPIRTIAVLPMANLSGDASQEYFADGITDELIMTLGRIRGITMISRTSVMRFKGSRASLSDIATALGADAVLEGSVMVSPAPRSGGTGEVQRVRINARLMHGLTEAPIWDRTFERTVGDVLSLQSEVARAVTDGIDSRLTAQVRQLQTGTAVNPESYDAYLRARYLANRRTPEDLRKAIDQFEAAVAADPASALAWAGLADGFVLLSSDDQQDPREAWPRARAAAERALQIEDLSEAHAALAAYEWWYDRDSTAADREFQRALDLNPNYAIAHARYSLYLNEVGRFDEALTEVKRARDLDPLSLVTEVNFARSYYFSRQYGQAEELLRALEQREPEFWVAPAILGQVYIAQHRLDDAIAALARARTLSPNTVRNLGVLGDALGRAGRRAEAQELLRQLTELSRRQYVSPIYASMIHMGLGDTERALDLLERAYAERSDWIMQMNVDAQFDPIREEPRFRELLRQTGQIPSPLP